MTAEVHAVGQSVHALEQRIAPMESDVQRTAQGVGLLCEVVAGLSGNTRPELRRRLDRFTGVGDDERRMAERTGEPEPPPPRPELLPPGGAAGHSELFRALLQHPHSTRA